MSSPYYYLPSKTLFEDKHCNKKHWHWLISKYIKYSPIFGSGGVGTNSFKLERKRSPLNEKNAIKYQTSSQCRTHDLHIAGVFCMLIFPTYCWEWSSQCSGILPTVVLQNTMHMQTYGLTKFSPLPEPVHYAVRVNLCIGLYNWVGCRVSSGRASVVNVCLQYTHKQAYALRR